MDALHIDQSSPPIQANRTINLMLAFKVFLWASITAILFLLGLLIELGPKWPPGIIHIPLAPHHGFTDQDAVALMPFSLGIVWFGVGIWKNRTGLRHYIRQYPEKSFLFALVIGLTLGLLMGIILGAIFETYVAYVYRLF